MKKYNIVENGRLNFYFLGKCLSTKAYNTLWNLGGSTKECIERAEELGYTEALKELCEVGILEKIEGAKMKKYVPIQETVTLKELYGKVSYASYELLGTTWLSLTDIPTKIIISMYKNIELLEELEKIGIIKEEEDIPIQYIYNPGDYFLFDNHLYFLVYTNKMKLINVKNGHLVLGNYDIFVSSISDSQFKTWMAPKVYIPVKVTHNYIF